MSIIENQYLGIMEDQQLLRAFTDQQNITALQKIYLDRIDAAEKAIKHDDGKPPMSLLSRIALEEIAKVLDFGRQKYSTHNWRKGFTWSRVLDAASRHLYAFIDGEDTDPETGLSHMAHLGCCVMFMLEFEKTHKNLDDRYNQRSGKCSESKCNSPSTSGLSNGSVVTK